MSNFDLSEINLSLHPRQTTAFLSQATEILFGGASGGGKSHFVRVVFILLCALIPGFQCVIFRKYKRDLAPNHIEGRTGFKALLAQWIRDGRVKIVEDEIRFYHKMPDGTVMQSNIALQHLQRPEDMDKAQGVPRHAAAFDEAPQIQERYIRFIRGWIQCDLEFLAEVARILDALPEPLKSHMQHFKNRLPLVLYTGNPMGQSVNYFRKNFVKPVSELKIWRAPDSDGGHLRQYIPSRLEHNLSIDQEAKRRSIRGASTDEAVALALEKGDWDAPVGDFIRQYDDQRHAVSNFMPPDHWFKFLTFDWGSSEPFAVLWWAVSDGKPYRDYKGKEKWLRRECLVCYREWYGCSKTDTAKGLELRNAEIADGIIKRTNEETSGLVITDSLPFQDRGSSKNGKKYKIADEFMEAGVPLIHGNTARIYGWKQVKDRLIGIDDDPMMVFTESCVYCRDYLPALQRHDYKQEDAQESGEATHICDAIRLAATTKPIVQDSHEGSQPQYQSSKISPRVKDLLELVKKAQARNDQE